MTNNTQFKPTLKQYGSYKVKQNISVKKILTVLALLPLGTSWLFPLIPFVKGYVRLRL